MPKYPYIIFSLHYCNDTRGNNSSKICARMCKMLKKCYVPCESPQEGVGVTTRGLRHLCLAGLGMRRAKQTSKCSICSYQLNIWYVAPSHYDIKLFFGRGRGVLGLLSPRHGSAQYCSPSGSGPTIINIWKTKLTFEYDIGTQCNVFFSNQNEDKNIFG